MRLSTEALGTSVVVRRVWIGAAPFRWEVCRGDPGTPLFVSSDRFRSMHDAYLAGQARLSEFLPRRSMPPGVTKNREARSREIGPGVDAARA